MSFAPLVPQAPRMSQRKSVTFATLDVGASKIVCLITRVTPEATGRGREHVVFRRRVLGVGHQKSRGVKAGAIVDLEAAEKAMRLAVDAAERMAGVEAHGVIVNISGGRLAARRSRAETALDGRAVTQADVQGALAAATRKAGEGGRALLHAVPMSYALDDTVGVRDPIGMLGDHLGAEAALISCDSAVARNLILAVERCHLRASALVASPYAAGLATLVGDEAELGAAIVDFGGGSTTIGVFSGSRLVHADAVAIGGNHVTMDLARGLGVSLADAERLKTLHGACIDSPSDEHETVSVHRLGEDMDVATHVPRADLVRIVRPRVEEVLELVRDRLKNAGFAAQAGRRLVMTGGGSQLTGLAEMARRVVSNQVRVGLPAAMDGLPESARNPAFAVSLGLAMYPEAAANEFSPGVLDAAAKARRPKTYAQRVGRWIKESF